MANKNILEIELTKEEVMKQVKAAINFEIEKITAADYMSEDTKELLAKITDSSDKDVDAVLDKSITASVGIFKELGDMFIENVKSFFSQMDSDLVTVLPFIAATHISSIRTVNQLVEEFENDKEVNLLDMCDNYLYASTVHKILETVLVMNKESWKGVDDTQEDLELVEEMQSRLSECAITLLKEAKNIQQLILTSKMSKSLSKDTISSLDKDGKKVFKTHFDATDSKYKN